MKEIIPLNRMVHEAIEEFTDFKDYDDANLIHFYLDLPEELREAIDNVFTYLSGYTFENIIALYQEQYKWTDSTITTWDLKDLDEIT